MRRPRRRRTTTLTRAYREISRCQPGEVVFTEGFNLSAKFVIHTVGPHWQGGQHGEARMLAGCYRSSLQLARRLGVGSIAFPAIGTGLNGYPVDEAAGIAVAEIRRFLASDASLDVSIVCFDQKEVRPPVGFTVPDENGEMRPISEGVSRTPDANVPIEELEHCVRVEWIKSVPVVQAIKERAFLATRTRSPVPSAGSGSTRLNAS